MAVGDVREVEITERCDIEIYTSDEFPQKEEFHKETLGIGIDKDIVIDSNEVLARVPEKEEGCEDNVIMEVDTKSDKEEDGVRNA